MIICKYSLMQIIMHSTYQHILLLVIITRGTLPILVIGYLP